jgi:hypothetical protein
MSRDYRAIMMTLPRKNLLLAICTLTLATSSLPAQDNLFPTIPGWRLTIDSTVYTPRNLWNLIDGSAELFLSYGFVDLTIGQYMMPDSLDVRVEAYRHASPTFAFGIYASERKPDYQFIEVGTQGYQESGILNFLSGEYYVKLSTHSSGTRANAAIRMIAIMMASALDRPREWPAGLRLLPMEGRQANTEAFVAQNFLGYSFLENAFSALYGKGDGFLIFVIECPKKADADVAVKKYRAVVPAASPRYGGTRFQDSNNGPVTLLQKDNFLFGLVNPPGDDIEAHYVSLIKQPVK